MEDYSQLFRKELLEELKRLAKLLEETTDPAEKARLLQLLARLGAGLKPGIMPGKGPGMGQRGQGEGGKAPEKDDADTDFKPDQARSALTAGKMLLKWKERGISHAGKAKEEYLHSVEKVKQGVSEAILHEQIPPGYHEAIKKYFDTMGEKDEKKKSK